MQRHPNKEALIVVEVDSSMTATPKNFHVLLVDKQKAALSGISKHWCQSNLTLQYKV